jgi:diguanylate cyclase (GGDEF)-like protein
MKTSRLTGEFLSRGDEAAFLEHKNAQTRPLLGFTLLFCTIFYVAFSVTDWAALGASRDFVLLLGARLLVAAIAGSCAWLAYRKPLTVRTTRIVASIAEAAALGCFMFIAALRPLEFHWHAMSLAIMLIVVYLYIPNSLANAAILASLATVGFFSLALLLGRPTRADVVTMGMLLVLANAFGVLAARRFNRASREEFRAQAQLQNAAERDHLTGCYNRRYLHEGLLEREVLRARRFGHSLSVLLCDIDNFKKINDTYGHADGDAVLRNFAHLITGMTRQGVDSVVRYGGEEFLAILPETNLQGGIQLAERLRAAFAASATPSADSGDNIRTTASIGVACADFAYGVSEDTLRELISTADKLMYEAKRSGRDCVRALQLV